MARALLATLCVASIIATSANAQVDRTRLERIVHRMEEFVEAGQMAGAVMLLARHGEILLHEAVGFADLESHETMRTDTIFQVQSMTKSVTATAIMTLIEDDRLRLTDPVSLYLPAFQDLRVITAAGHPELEEPHRPITIRDLLTHSSGMRHGHHSYATAPDVDTLKEVVDGNAAEPLTFQPGTTFGYSNYGMETLGRIIEVITRQTYDAYVRERILASLDMEDSFFRPSQQQRDRIAEIYRVADGTLTLQVDDPSSPFAYPNPAAGLFSTAQDMFAFYQMTLAEGVYEGVRILSLASVSTMTTAHTNSVGRGRFSGYGYGFAVVRDPIGTLDRPLQQEGAYGHYGYWGTVGWVNPTSGLVGVFLTHYRNGSSSREFAEVFMAMATAVVAD